jgi:hypothetical protein
MISGIKSIVLDDVYISGIKSIVLDDVYNDLILYTVLLIILFLIVRLIKYDDAFFNDVDPYGPEISDEPHWDYGDDLHDVNSDDDNSDDGTSSSDSDDYGPEILDHDLNYVDDYGDDYGDDLHDVNSDDDNSESNFSDEPERELPPVVKPFAVGVGLTLLAMRIMKFYEDNFKKD